MNWAANDHVCAISVKHKRGISKVTSSEIHK